MDNPRLGYLREKARQLPLEPGVYFMKDKSGKIIYVGKAKQLKNRVSSYFRSVEKHLPKVYQMVSLVYDFDTIITDSEFEALVLECSMIKQYAPKYNILLKDDKGYSYIKIHPQKWGRVTAEKQRLEDGARYIGPYTSSFVVNQTVDEVNRIFMLPTCKRNFPADFGKGRPCLNYHIKQCMGVCRGKVSEEEYEEVLNQAVDFIKGGSSQTLKLMQQKMEQAAETLEFERAARYRDRINAIQRATEHQKVVYSRVENQDVIAITQSADDTCVVVLKFREQRLVDKEDFLIGQADDLPAARREFLTSYYGGTREIPRLIALDGPCEDEPLLEQYLCERAGHKVTFTRPVRGDGAKVVEMARNNAAQRLSSSTSGKKRTNRETAALDELARLLGLSKVPEYIEAYDISNIGSDTIVAGMVVFENARPLKSAYRKFNIKTVQQNDDYASMREVILRRLQHYLEEKDAPKTAFGRLPDLILLDGGRGHVAAVQPILDEMGLKIPLFGMVKDDKHKTRAIAGDGGEIAISSVRSAFTLVSSIQEEVHRFSIRFSRSKHQKKSFELLITKVPGVGPARARALFSHFKTMKAIRQASIEELAAVETMTKTAAQNLYEALHSETEK